jgi:hypothetical protein
MLVIIMNLNYEKIIKEMLIIISLISFWGAVVYRFFALNALGIILSLILAMLSYIILLFKFPIKLRAKSQGSKESKQAKRDLWKIGVPILYLISAITCFIILFLSRSDLALITPWQVVTPLFFLCYAIATGLLVLGIFRGIPGQAAWLSLHFFLSFSVAAIVYRLGYGFDPFIHQATERLISQLGAVSPKPFYYLGQYSLVVIFHKILFIPIDILDRFLVPFLASFALPAASLSVFRSWFKEKRSIALTILFLLTIPFSFFILTTPQHLAWLLLLLTVIYSLSCRSWGNLLRIYILALAALTVHPIAGLPALFLAVTITLFHSQAKRKNLYYAILLILIIFTLPLAFLMVNNAQDTSVAVTDPSYTPSESKLFSLPNKEGLVLNSVYLYGFNFGLLIGGLVLFGFVLFRRYKKDCSILVVHLVLAFGLILSWLITKYLNFSYLINYERDNFSDRILFSSLIVLFPFIMIALFALTKRIMQNRSIVRYIWLTFLVLLILFSLYISYPRFDNYHNSRGFSTSQSDVKAVRWIEGQTNKEYIVLANQQVSAAALRELGFKKYFQSNINGLQTDVFFYPIPTGGPLYQYYLDMVYVRPTRETALKAAEMVGAEEVYFVLNQYWWAYPKLVEEAKLEADETANIDKSRVFVFKYVK